MDFRVDFRECAGSGIPPPHPPTHPHARWQSRPGPGGWPAWASTPACSTTFQELAVRLCSGVLEWVGAWATGSSSTGASSQQGRGPALHPACPNHCCQLMPCTRRHSGPALHPARIKASLLCLPTRACCERRHKILCASQDIVACSGSWLSADSVHIHVQDHNTCIIAASSSQHRRAPACLQHRHARPQPATTVATSSRAHQNASASLSHCIPSPLLAIAHGAWPWQLMHELCDPTDGKAV